MIESAGLWAIGATVITVLVAIFAACVATARLVQRSADLQAQIDALRIANLQERYVALKEQREKEGNAHDLDRAELEKQVRILGDSSLTARERRLLLAGASDAAGPSGEAAGSPPGPDAGNAGSPGELG